MCNMESHIDQPIMLNPAKPSPTCDDGFMSCLPSKVEKSRAVSSPSESGKKKRVQRAAKLKQCKMDARREQWLAQVSGKVVKPDSCASSHSSTQDDRDEKAKLIQPSPGEVTTVFLVDKEVKEDSQYKQPIGSSLTDGLSCVWPDGVFCSQQECLMDGSKHEPFCYHINIAKPLDHRDVEPKPGQTQRLDIPVIWSRSDTGSSQSNSSSDDEMEVEDWEAVADALHMQATVEDATPAIDDSKGLSGSGTNKCILKPESKYRPGSFGSRNSADAGRAWAPDDVSRPPTLPRLSKQHSFPCQSGPCLWAPSHTNVWSLPPPPSHCPICTEELDNTDSSFVPCFCGFRLCLFCHHRILLGDGRCPGCRKSYNLEAALKLSRTWSDMSRV